MAGSSEWTMRAQPGLGYRLLMRARLLRTAVVLAVALAAGAGYVSLLPGDFDVSYALLTAIVFALLLWPITEAVASARAAQQARRLAAHTESRSIDDAVSAALEEERRRLAVDIEAIVRRSVERMRMHVERLRGAPDDDAGAVAALREVQREGRGATVELRRLIGLLRGPVSVPPPAAGRGRRRRWPADAALAGLLAVIAVAEHFSTIETYKPLPEGGAWLAAAAAAATVLWRARPGLAAMIQALLFVAGMLAGVPVSTGLWTLVAIGLPVWAALSRPPASALSLLGPAASLSAELVSQWLHFPESGETTTAFFAIVVVGAIVARASGARRRAALTRAELHEAQLAAAAAAEVERDRAAMARELHDAISGTIGVIVLQAGAAELRWRTDRSTALAAVAVIAAAAEEALRDLDDLLASLPAIGGGAAASGSTARGADDLRALVERMRRAGLDLRVRLPAGLETLPPEVAMTVYRVAQESLANAARHAPGARVELTLGAPAGHGAERSLELEVRDDGSGPPRAPSAGHGLVGLQERVAAMGGTLTAGPLERGGFAVLARIPVPETMEAL